MMCRMKVNIFSKLTIVVHGILVRSWTDGNCLLRNMRQSDWGLVVIELWVRMSEMVCAQVREMSIQLVAELDRD
jgi:hypothetical protein